MSDITGKSGTANSDTKSSTRNYMFCAVAVGFVVVCVFVAIAAARLLPGTGCDDRCEFATIIAGTNFAIQTDVYGLETATYQAALTPEP